MFPTSAIALFCDDIREEKTGALTLVGVLGDNVHVPAQEDPNLVGMIPKLAIYIRVNFDVSADLGPIVFKIEMPDGTIHDGGTISEETIAGARSTRKKGNPLGGIVSRIILGGLTMAKLGRMTVTAIIGNQTYIAGYLNFVSAPDTT